MSAKRIEFGVARVERGPEGILVAGRCYQGPIAIGDIFQTVYQLIPTKTADGYGPSVRVGDRLVSLCVNAIRAYGYSLPEIDTGLVAELEVIGSGGESLQQWDVLGVLTPE